MSGSSQRGSLTAAIAAITIVGVMLGLTMPLLSLILERDQVDTALIGLSAATPAAGIILIAPAVPFLARRLGTPGLMYLAIALTLAALVLLKLFANVYAWFPIRLLLGAAVGVLFIVSETWINGAVDDRVRGRMMGLYTAVLSAGIACGPLILALIGTTGWAPFAVAAAIATIAAVPVILARRIAPVFSERPSAGLVTFVRGAPAATCAGLMLGLMEASAMALFPLYAVRTGLSAASALVLLSTFTAGGIVMPLAFGWLADRADRHSVLALCAAVSIAAIAFVPIVGTASVLVWPAVFAWGGAVCRHVYDRPRHSRRAIPRHRSGGGQRGIGRHVQHRQYRRTGPEWRRHEPVEPARTARRPWWRQHGLSCARPLPPLASNTRPRRIRSTPAHLTSAHQRLWCRRSLGDQRPERTAWRSR